MSEVGENRMGFGEAITSGFKNYANFSGRSPRAAYWWWALFHAAVLTVAAIVAIVLGTRTATLIFFGIPLFALMLPGIAVSVRRLHDVDMGGWWWFLGLLPFGGIVLIFFFVRPSDPVPNRFGRPPYGVAPGAGSPDDAWERPELGEGEPILKVENLEVRFDTEDGVVQAVNGVSFEIRPGETVGIVGESGSGKSVTNLSLLGLTRADNTTITGTAQFEGRDLISLRDDELRAVRGNGISMIFQDPLSSLHPFFKVGNQLVEAMQVHRDISDADARSRAIELLGLVGIPDPERRVGEYPHEFSGGMRQRAMIAMALTNDPQVLIADEPTTALDVTTQAQILRLLESLRDRFGMAVIMITHDLGVIAEVADRVLVMYGGRVVESGTLDQIFYDPQHPYSWGLLGSLTRTDQPRTARLAQIAGQPPSLITPPQGCPFRPRCPHEFGKCMELPPLEVRGGEPGHLDRCWLDPETKRKRRVVANGEFGLDAKKAPEPAPAAPLAGGEDA